MSNAEWMNKHNLHVLIRGSDEPIVFKQAWYDVKDGFLATMQMGKHRTYINLNDIVMHWVEEREC